MSDFDEPTTDQLADILAESREWIVENGWARGAFQVIEVEYDEEIQEDTVQVIGYCAMGGVLYSQQIPEAQCSLDPRTNAVATALCRAAGISTHHAQACTLRGHCSCVLNWVTHWNDEDDRTEQDVLDAYMQAEKEARGGNINE